MFNLSRSCSGGRSGNNFDVDAVLLALFDGDGSELTATPAFAGLSCVAAAVACIFG